MLKFAPKSVISVKLGTKILGRYRGFCFINFVFQPVVRFEHFVGC